MLRVVPFPPLRHLVPAEEKSNVIIPAWDGIIESHSNDKNFVFYYLVVAATVSNEPEILLPFILPSYYAFPCWGECSKNSV